MHELSISTAIVDTALRYADGQRVGVVSLRLGTLRQVVPSSLSFYFEIASRDTLCEGARLDLELIDAAMSCGSCGREWDPAPPLPRFRCPQCGAAGGEVLRGNELEVESIEVEEGSAVNA